MGVGQRLNKFFTAVQQGVEQKKAFQDTFGDFKQVQQDFDSTSTSLRSRQASFQARPRSTTKTF
jgi:peptidoglycan hydrolase CwlO-like protein